MYKSSLCVRRWCIMMVEPNLQDSGCSAQFWSEVSLQRATRREPLHLQTSRERLPITWILLPSSRHYATFGMVNRLAAETRWKAI